MDEALQKRLALMETALGVMRKFWLIDPLISVKIEFSITTDGANCASRTKYLDHVITLNPQQLDDNRMYAFLAHEVAHVVMTNIDQFVTDVGQNHMNTYQTQLEQMVERLSLVYLKLIPFEAFIKQIEDAFIMDNTTISQIIRRS